MKRFSQILWMLINTSTAMIGYTIHGSLPWAIVDFVVAPLAWLKWLICREVSLRVIRETFSFFFN